MKISKKIISLIMLIAIVITTLAGCSSANSNGKEEESSTVENIKFYTWEDEGYREQHQAIKEAFEKENPDINVEFVYLSNNNNGDYVKKLDTLLMTDEDIDIFGQAGNGDFIVKAKADLYEPLDSYFDEEGIKFEDTYNNAVTVDGSVYGIPTNMKLWLVYLNKKHLDEAGLEVPALDWTWEDYREYAKAVTTGEGTDKRYGSYMHTWPNYLQFGIVSYLKNPLFYDDNEELIVDEPMFKNWLQFRYDLENVDKTQSPYSDVKALNLAYRTQFINEKATMIPSGSWLITELKDLEKMPHDFITTFATLPKFENGEDGRTLVESHYFGVNKKSKHKEAAYKFLRFFSEQGTTIEPTALSAAKSVDNAVILDAILGENPEKIYDVDALKNVINNPNAKYSFTSSVSDIQSQTSDIVVEESEKFLFGGIGLEEALANMKERYEQLVKITN
jgi:multiple sugar transport system substrate-binding protein